MLISRTGPALFLSLSFVFSGALAATDTPDPGLDNPTPAEAPTKAEEPPNSSVELLDVTQPVLPTREEKKHSTQARETFYPYQTSISPRLGYLLADQSNTSGSQNYLLGFRYMADSPLAEHWEIGADLISNSTGFFEIGKKWLFFQHSAFRPFAKYSVAILIEPVKALGSFIEFRNYQVRGGGGFEYLLIAPMSLRVDLEAGFGLRGLWAAIVLGYSWAW